MGQQGKELLQLCDEGQQCWQFFISWFTAHET